jgi:DNA-binding NtrC family response regulator
MADGLQAPIPRGTERIMLIDDEEKVRNVERDILSSLGYKIEAFAGPLEALEHFTAHSDRIDLVITDMTMPKMTGDKLAQKIMALRPDMPVILCTGFSDLINEEAAMALGIKKYITKPVIMHSFGRSVRDVLDGIGR